MRQAITGTLLVMLIAMILITGCSKTVVVTDPVYNNMTDNETVPIDVVDPVINESIVLPNTTVIVNETIVPNETIIDNSTIIVNEPNPDSEYYQYRDTGLIDESIEDLE